MLSSISGTAALRRTSLGFNSALRTCAHVAIGAAAFLTVCGILRSRYPLQGIPQISPKLEHLRMAGGSYDTLFLGSSRIRNHVDPILFDRLCHEAGFETSSYNFGVAAMIVPELPFVLDEILRIRPPRLKRVIIDMNGFRRTFGRGNEEDGIRSVYWHDLPRTCLVLRALIQDPTGLSPLERLDLGRRHLGVFARNLSCVGLAQEVIQSRHAERSAVDADAATLGFVPVDDTMPEGEREEYAKDLAATLAIPDRAVKSDPALAFAHAQMAKKLRKAHLHPYYLMSPMIGEKREYTPEPAQTFYFDDPRAYPTLFDPRNRYNGQHLNRAGSEELTRFLAAQFIERLRKGE